MASRILANKALAARAAPALRQAMIFPRSLAAVAPRLAVVQQRFQSTANETTAKPADPKVVAESLLNALPGDNLAAKSSSFLVAASIATYLISKEIYILDGETFEAICALAAFYVWYAGAKDLAIGFFNEKKETIRRVLTQAREADKAAVQERIDQISQLSDAVDVTKSLFEISRDIAKLEAEAYELKQRIAFNTEIKAVLDAWARHEANVREQEQKKIASHVIEKIKADLADPKFQQAILSQTLSDVEKLVSSRRA